MTRERIEDMREVVLPFVKKRLLETNYENLGESDAEMFAKDFDEILDLAIKALEQESCEDTISREAVLSLFNNSDDYRWETTLIKKKIEKIPPITSQEPKWIPVSERLPKANEFEDKVRKYYLVQNEYDDMLVAYYDGCYWSQIYTHSCIKDRIVAWMPLPRPFEPQESEVLEDGNDD